MKAKWSKIRKESGGFWVLGLTVCLLFLAAGCSTRRNTFVSRNFHNLTSYYNVYWNGTQSLLDADYLLKQQSVDNYFKVLPVFKYGNPADTAMISQQTIRMIEKSLKTVKKHSISIGGKEHVKTIDNAYLLLGQGFFYQQKYSKARSVYNFILSEFPNNPEKYEAMLWIARTYIREQDFSMASSFISQVEAQGPSALMKQTYRDLPLVQAEFYIQQEKYKEAVPYVQEGILRCKDRDMKARLYFILGQISQNDGNGQQAYNYYKECLKLNPPLDLVFNARMNMALCFNGPSVNIRDVMKGLERMLRDSKNQAYFGRIYYVMGEISFRQKKEKDAVRYMDLSISSSEGDPARTLMAAKRLSAYFYEGKQYIESQKYYEIAAKVVEDNDPDYYTIVSRAKNLAELTVHYRQLTSSDTLKMVGKMDKRDQKRYAERKAKEYVAQQEAIRKAKEESKSVDMSTPGRSNWYFYNEQTKNAGLAEFNRIWGRRELTDLWFLSAKPAISALRPASQSEEGEVLAEAPKIITQADPEYYLQQLPVTDSAFKALDSMIEPSLYHVGMIYSDMLGENKEGEHYLVRLVNEYPKSNYLPSACETLCKIYRQEGDMASYQRYADILAQQYPETEQNDRVNNPNYYKDLEANSKKVESLYTQAYNKLLQNDFQSVYQLAVQVEEEYPVHSYREQFLYLKTVATAHIRGYKEMIPMAELFVKSYPESPLAERMNHALNRAKSDLEKNILFPDSDPVISLEEATRRQSQNLAESIQQAHGVNPGSSGTGEISSADSSEENKSGSANDTIEEKVVKVDYLPVRTTEEHYVVMVCSDKERNPEAMQLRVEGFNDKYYSQSKLKMEQLDAGDHYMIVVSKFPAMRGAISYRNMIAGNDYVYGALSEKNVYVISNKNLELLKSSGDYKGYAEYHQKTYGELLK